MVDDLNAYPDRLCPRRAFVVADAYTEVLSRIGAIRAASRYDALVRVTTDEDEAVQWLTAGSSP